VNANLADVNVAGEILVTWCTTDLKDKT